MVTLDTELSLWYYSVPFFERENNWLDVIIWEGHLTEPSHFFGGRASLVAQTIKNPPAMWETWVQSLGWEDPLEKGMATHSSILAWRIPWTEGPGRLQSMGSQRVGHNWMTFTLNPVDGGMRSEINSVTNILRIVYVFSVTGCSETEGSDGPVLKGFSSGTSVVGKVGQEKSTLFQWYNEKESCVTRDFLV